MHFSAWLLLACLVCGCSVNLSGELEKTLPKLAHEPNFAGLPYESLAVANLSGPDRVVVDRFTRVVDQIKKKTAGPLPDEIVNEPVTRAFVAALGNAVVIPVEITKGMMGLAIIDWKLDAPSLDASDGKSFALALRKVLNPVRPDARTKARALQPGGQEFWKDLGQYLDAYVQGTYLDDLGGRIAKPKFNNGIGNDTIVGVETVFLEYLADWLLQTPLITDENGKYLNPGKMPPTAKLVRPTKTLSQAQLTEKQVHAIQCACSLAGDGGLALSGVLVRSIGGLNAGPVFVLGKFSFGDNQTAAKVLETVFEVAFRNAIEAAVYSMLTHATLYGAIMTGADYSCLLDLL